MTLSLFVGFEVISKVPPLLHTPLMSGSNAISGITIVGARAGRRTVKSGRSLPCSDSSPVVFATTNVVGGFLVTNRMLAMFKKKPDRP